MCVKVSDFASINYTVRFDSDAYRLFRTWRKTLARQTLTFDAMEGFPGMGTIVVDGYVSDVYPDREWFAEQAGRIEITMILMEPLRFVESDET